MIEEFERLRPYLLRLAYSHLGSLSEAEDVVQEAWLRLQRVDPGEIRDLRRWLTTVVGRLAIDALTSARARREQYVGEWLPEPVVRDEVQAPADQLTLDESVSMAMLVVLESLTPAERSAFLLHDVFGYAFAEVAEIVGRTPDAVRQLASRARRKVKDRRPAQPAPREEQRRIVEAFLDASRQGDIARLLEMLDPEAEWRSDGGGVVPAIPTVFVGAERIARAWAAMAKRFTPEVASIVDVNGAPGLLIERGDDISVVAVTIDGGRIREIDVVRNPEKLRGIPRPRRGRPAPRRP